MLPFFFFFYKYCHIYLTSKLTQKKIPLFPKHNLKNDNDIINDIFNRYIKEESSLFSCLIRFKCIKKKKPKNREKKKKKGKEIEKEKAQAQKALLF